MSVQRHFVKFGYKREDTDWPVVFLSLSRGSFFLYTGISCASFSRSRNFEIATEKLISFDSGSDMLALQAFMVFAEMGSIPVVF